MKKYLNTDFSEFINEKKVDVFLGKEKIATLNDEDTVKYNKAVHKIKNSVDSVELEIFLSSYLKKLEFVDKEAIDFKQKILNIFEKSWNSNVQLTPFLNQLDNDSKKLSINSLINSKDIVKDISIAYGSIPEEFIEKLILLDGKASSSSAGKGELFLAFFTELHSASKLDLYNPRTKEIYEIKGEGGFRVGSGSGKRVKQVVDIINNATLSNYDNSKPFNITSGGNGLNLKDLLKDFFNKKEQINYKTLNTAFLTFEKSYEKDMDSIIKKVIESKNFELFNSYLAIIQLYGYMKAENINHIILFTDNFKRIKMFDLSNNFKTFWNTYNNTLRTRGWENDSRNTSFRIFPTK